MNTLEMNQAFIVAAYSVTWIVLLGYLARVVRKSSAARKQYERIRAAGDEGRTE